MKILVIAPHADDELFGVGGTLLRHKKNNDKIKIILVSCSNIEMRHAGLVTKEIRHNEFLDSAKQLSNSNPKCFFLEDSKLDMFPISNLITMIENEISQFNPDIVYIPEPSYHQDHQVVSRASIASLRPTNICNPKKVYMYEIPTSVWDGGTNIFKPNTYIDIKNEIKQKNMILKNSYPSQYSNERGRLACDSITSQAKYRGCECGLEYAEAFMLLREVM